MLAEVDLEQAREQQYWSNTDVFVFLFCDSKSLLVGSDFVLKNGTVREQFYCMEDTGSSATRNVFWKCFLSPKPM